jgi:hypothetical protein
MTAKIFDPGEATFSVSVDPPLRGGDFQGMRVYRPMTSSLQRATREKDLPRR